MIRSPLAAIPEERVAGILARAAELDRDRRETFTVDAVRAAALDAGIGEAAVNAALAEYAAERVAARGRVEGEERTPRFARLRRWLGRAAQALRTPVRIGALFVVIGLAGAAGEGPVILAWAGWFAYALWRAIRQRPTRRAAPFALTLVLMTFGLMFGFAMGDVDEDAIVALLPVGAALLAFGTLLIKLRLPRRAGADRRVGLPAA